MGMTITFRSHGLANELTSWGIDYATLLATDDPAGPHALLRRELPSVWCRLYLEHVPDARDLRVVEVRGATYVYDCTWSAAHGTATPVDRVPDDRVVGVHTTSRPATRPRDKRRMQGFPKGGMGVVLPELSALYDRGHLIGRALGGGEDINLIPQLATINRGAKSEFRRMERYCSQHPGTFLFLRPYYRGISDHPAVLEFGVLRHDHTLWINACPNVERFDDLKRLDEALVAVRTTTGPQHQPT
jgi:hypothetical protein